jgi:hypothetical protein
MILLDVIRNRKIDPFKFEFNHINILKCDFFQIASQFYMIKPYIQVNLLNYKI